MAAHINRHIAGASSTATPDGPAVAAPVASHGGTGSTAAKRLLSEDDVIAAGAAKRAALGTFIGAAKGTGAGKGDGFLCSMAMRPIL